MVIPNQPPLTATKKSTPKAQTPVGVPSVCPSSVSPVAKPQGQMAPQPVPASYATASTPSQPTFNVQVRPAQPGPQHPAPGGHHFGQQPIRNPTQVQYMPAQPKGPDFAYGPPQPGFSPMAQGAYQPQHYQGAPQAGSLSSRKPDPGPTQPYQPPGPKKTYITDVPPSLAPYTSGPTVPPKVKSTFFWKGGCKHAVDKLTNPVYLLITCSQTWNIDSPSTPCVVIWVCPGVPPGPEMPKR